MIKIKVQMSRKKKSTISLKSPDRWGPVFWQIIHTTSLLYPEKPKKCEKKRMMAFLKGIINQIPCSLCRNSFRNELMIRDKKTKRFRFRIHKLSSREVLTKCLRSDVQNAKTRGFGGRGRNVAG